MMNKQRDNSIDIAKAVCIILMVVGHSGCHEYVGRFIYMFHMPCFFFISGWLLNDKYLSDLKTGLYQKAKGSYVPFVKWTLIFLFCHNIFACLHIYDSMYTADIFVERLLRAFTMTGSEQLLGGFWFLISLFWASCVSLLFLFIIKKCGRFTIINISGGVILLLVLATFWHLIASKLPSMFGVQTVLATCFYLTGYLCSKTGLFFKNQLMIFVLFMILPIVVSMFMSMSMVDVEGFMVFLYFFTALSGSFGVMFLSSWMSDKGFLSSVMAYIGERTLYILVFHFLSFKLVSTGYILFTNSSWNLLSSFPVIPGLPAYMSLIYTVAGVCVPLLLWKLFNFRK